MDINQRREWMDNRNFPGRRGLMPSFVAGVKEFLDLARTTESYLTRAKIKCPCEKCKCVLLQDLETVEVHLYKRGFMPNYYVWDRHGEPWDLQEHIQLLRNIHGTRSAPVEEPDRTNYRMDFSSSQQSECESNTAAPLTREQEMNLWLEVNGGVKKGSAYGLATLYSSGKNKANYLSSSPAARSSATDPGEMARVREEIAELKKQSEAILQSSEALRISSEVHQRETQNMFRKLMAKKKKKKSKGKHKDKRRYSSESTSDAESSSGSTD